VSSKVYGRMVKRFLTRYVGTHLPRCHVTVICFLFTYLIARKKRMSALDIIDDHLGHISKGFCEASPAKTS